MRAALVALLLVGATIHAHAQVPARPVVVELFTSQGCSSCPPADSLLTELATRPDILALAFHVTYWNGLGWRDPFSLEVATQRQRAYQRLLNNETVYTPQMVVDGRIDVVGSDRTRVYSALRQSDTRTTVPVSLTQGPGGLMIVVGAGTGAQNAAVWLVGYDSAHSTTVPRGENAGRRLSEANIVRSFITLGQWQGVPLTLTSPALTTDRVAVILQSLDGTILGAAVLPKPNNGASG